jgi:hypothetical protein
MVSKRIIAPVALLSAGLVYGFLLRPWHLRWGATEAEVEEQLPGDDLTPDPVEQATHAITIHAPVSEVWPWLAQVGQTRGGFYSYAWLENLVGCQMHNTDEIVPEWQHIQVGDEVWLHPKVPPLPVLLVEPHKALVFGSNSNTPGTWGLYLKEVDAYTTRLIIRGRIHSGRTSVLGWLGYHGVFEPAHFIMERKMMLTIKRLAEQSQEQIQSRKENPQVQ